MINNHHQDWETVVFKKKSNKQQQPQPKSSSSAACDDAVKKTKYISKETSLAIISARCSKQMTQKDLAQKCNFDISIITNIEKGVSVYNATHVNRIQTVLGVIIPR
jgi:ribosome-binding protein aMBF1 (putative translation factor)